MSALTRADVVRLFALAIIWSASFVFMRIVAPAMGPLWTATLRVLVGGTALVAWFAFTGFRVDVRRHWRGFLFVGLLNAAVPWLLFAFAALTLPASYLVILNAATPMFAAITSAIWLGDRLDAAKLAGLAAGAAGVALVSRAGPIEPTPAVWAAVAACLAATLSYALIGTWLKRRGGALDPKAVAGWSQIFAFAALLPVAAASPIPGPVTLVVVANLAGFAIVGAAFLLYFRLIRDVGPTRAMTVTFLMPAFGMLWGVVFLGETVTAPMVAGAALVVAGTAAVLRPARVASRAVPQR